MEQTETSLSLPSEQRWEERPATLDWLFFFFRLTDVASDRARLIAESGAQEGCGKPRSAWQLSKLSETNVEERSADNQLTV